MQIYRQTDGQTDGRTDGWTVGQIDINISIDFKGGSHGCFIDASKAFDKVHYGKLFIILMSKGHGHSL